MTYIKNQISQNNAIEAWAMAIRYCDYILEYVYFGSLDEQTMKKFFP